jgi:hypothetical protein
MRKYSFVNELLAPIGHPPGSGAAPAFLPSDNAR